MQETSSYLPSETPIIRHEWAFGKFQYFIIWPVSVLLLYVMLDAALIPPGALSGTKHFLI